MEGTLVGTQLNLTVLPTESIHTPALLLETHPILTTVHPALLDGTVQSGPPLITDTLSRDT